MFTFEFQSKHEDIIFSQIVSTVNLLKMTFHTNMKYYPKYFKFIWPYLMRIMFLAIDKIHNYTAKKHEYVISGKG